jgi:RNA polymerase sigma-70 factor (ECF subfamily)
VTDERTTTLAARFEAERPRLWAMAYRMLGSSADAEDAVQECWLRLDRADASSIQSLPAWLTTVTSRICLNVLRSRSRLEAPDDEKEVASDELGPEEEAVLADTLHSALIVVLDELSPPERIAFILHDVFEVPFDDIAQVLDRSPAATRQLASRARRRVREAPADPAASSHGREVVTAFLAASRTGDLGGLMRLLDEDATFTADPTAVSKGSPARIVGANEVATFFSSRARGVTLGEVDGRAVGVWRQGPRILTVFDFVVRNGRVVAVHIVADPDDVATLAPKPLRAAPTRQDGP